MLEDNTVNETTVAEEVEETNTDIENPIDLDLDHLINAEFDDPAMQGEHSGLPPYQEVLKHLPENARKLVQNLRSSYSRKTQELANERRRLQELEDSINQERELLLSQEWGFDSSELDENSDSNDRSTANSSADVEKRIQEAVTKALQSRFQPLKEKHQAQQRQIELSRFKQENPDLEELRPEITELLLDRPELNLKDAYLIVKGQKLSQQMRASRVTQRQVQQKIGAGNVGNTPKNKPPAELKDAYEIYQWHKQQREGK
jgi:hypothetical protein